MKVNGESIQPGASKVEKRNVDRNQRVNTAYTDSSVRFSQSASINLSGRAQEVGRFTAIAASSSEIGAARVAELQEQIQNGSYEVPYEALADKFLGRTTTTDSF